MKFTKKNIANLKLEQWLEKMQTLDFVLQQIVKIMLKWFRDNNYVIANVDFNFVEDAINLGILVNHVRKLWIKN